MSKNRKTEFNILSVALILFCAFHIFTFNNIGITDKAFFSVYRTISFILFCLLLAAISIVLPKDYTGLFGRLGIIILILSTGIIWGFVTIFFSFNEAKKDRQVLFVNKGNPKLIIVEQVIYAGVIGSDHYDTILTRQLIKNVRWTKPIQISQISKDAWMPASK